MTSHTIRKDLCENLGIDLDYLPLNKTGFHRYHASVIASKTFINLND